MGQKPLITRSELRKRKQSEQGNDEFEQEQAHKDYQQQEQEIDRFYRKELKKSRPVKSSRSLQQQKARKRNSFLNKAIVIVVILVIIVLLGAFFV